MTLIYLDTETTGLDPHRHEVWEIAYAVDDGRPIFSGFVSHTLIGADDDALRVGQYMDRFDHDLSNKAMFLFEDEVFGALDGRTVVGANPRFDAAFLEARWGKAPWRYRLFDIEAYAMPAAGWDEPQGLKNVANFLRNSDWDIPEPDHTAAGDVATLRACHLALKEIYRDD